MRVAYLEPCGGLSGDMMLGALVDVGLPLEVLTEMIGALGLADEVEVSQRRVMKTGISATKVDVIRVGEHHHGHAHEHENEHHHGRSAAALIEVIEGADLANEVIARSVEIVRRLAEAEAKIHDTTPEEVHFHELGGLDTIVDVVGAVEGLRHLGVERLHCAPLPIGHGWINCAHGRLPVPAPATAELLRGIPTRAVDVEGETVTPTGAALAAVLAEGFGRPADFVADRVGYGAGNLDFDPIPNLTRLWLSAESSGDHGHVDEAALVTVIEANIDDMSGELVPHAIEAVFEAGALDAWSAPIVMKKGRPGMLLRAICPPEAADAVASELLRQTTTLGLRMTQMERRCLRREKKTVQTRFGSIDLKLGYLDGETVTVSPEHDDCARAAKQHAVPIKLVYAAAVAAAEDMRQAGLKS